MSGGGSNNSSSVFPVTLLVFQVICAFIWLVGGDYAIGTSGFGRGPLRPPVTPRT